jgi:hypothetical protein
MIGMHVGIDDVRDAHALRLGKGGVVLVLPFFRVDDGTFAEGAAPEKVGRAATAEIVERSKNHGFLLPRFFLPRPHQEIILYSMND